MKTIILQTLVSNHGPHQKCSQLDASALLKHGFNSCSEYLKPTHAAASTTGTSLPYRATVNFSKAFRFHNRNSISEERYISERGFRFGKSHSSFRVTWLSEFRVLVDGL